MLNLASLLESSARAYPARDALVHNDRRYSYRDLDRYASRIAHVLADAGVQPGDRVALSCANLPEFVAAYYGILKNGSVVVPLNIMLKAREVAYHLEDSGAVAYLCYDGPTMPTIAAEGYAAFDQVESCHTVFALTETGDAPTRDDVTSIQDACARFPGVFPAAPTEATDTAVILYTSGTTGSPKGAELTHTNMTMNAITGTRMFDMTPERADRHLIALPLFHSFGQSVQMNAGIASAAALVFMPRFDPKAAMATMADEQITVFAGVPTMYWALTGLVADGEQAPVDLRLAISGGASLPVAIIDDVRNKFGVEIREGYGLSETSPLAAFNDPSAPSRPGSIGRPVWGVDLKLVDRNGADIEGVDEVGELAIRGHNVMKGYLGRPEATAEVLGNDGWFRSGDLARRDADGYYYIVDRAKDLIIRGGYNVYPREIEEVLMTHPAISLVAVTGVPHESHGEEIKAWVVLNPDKNLTADELINWTRDQMAAYKYPRIIEFLTELPMTATGKILKRALD
ncbi:long-chain-fatty-acid--CoA ligase [Nocardioides sp. Bht2]|uniref:long-chain-fatty-acid--CoA ligase n=1 Tax=Nocardioides sp. Bht2 TaxID=3392297 RepID=UPI0039B450EC